MDKPVEISFRNIDHSESLAAVIKERCEQLERFYRHIIGIHVTVSIPQRRHLQGKLYHLTIEVKAPHKRLVVSHSPGREIRHESPIATVNDAFHAMERQLEDYARRLRGDTKHHEIAQQGRITRIFPDRGYGFINLTDGEEIYFHENSVAHKAFSHLKSGTPVRVVLAEDESTRGSQASTVEPIRDMKLVDEEDLLSETPH